MGHVALLFGPRVKEAEPLPEDRQRRQTGTWTTGRPTDFVRCVGMLVLLLKLVLGGTSSGESVLVGDDADHVSGDLSLE